MGGGAITPQLPSPPLAAPLQPKTEPWQLGLGSFWPTCSAPRVSRMHNPITTTTLYAPSHHPYAPSPLPFHTAHPKSSHNGSVSGFGPNPLPACLPFCKHTAPPPQPPRTRHHTTSMHHPPSPFHMACLKLSHNSSVLDFGPNPPHCLA